MKNKNRKLLIIFILFFIFVIVLSLSGKAYNFFKESIFDGENQFDVLLVSKDNRASYYSISPKKKLVTVTNFINLSIEEFIYEYAIVPDGVVIDTDSDYEMGENIFLRLFFDPEKRLENINNFDLLRLYFSIRNSDFKTIGSLEYSKIKKSKKFKSLPGETLSSIEDERVKNEQNTIAIVNSTGVSGIGAQTERLVSLLGGNVISVSTDRKISETSFLYMDENYYSGNRISHKLGIIPVINDKSKLADILVIIGRDSLDDRLFKPLVPNISL